MIRRPVLAGGSVSRVGARDWARRFVALSRLPHVALDIATPAMAALLWLGRLPSAATVLIGLVTAFAGYTAVYALNDLVDRRMDRHKMDADDTSHDRYLDAVGGRHPVAQGLLTARQGWTWIAIWNAACIVGVLLLSPWCLVIYLSGAVLEAVYCSLYRVTPLRVLLSGVIKTLGGAAAIVAVDPHPQGLRVAVFLAMIFFWEIGGQNIPADWTDIDEDTRMKARTIPVHVGARTATVMIVLCLAAAIVLSITLLGVFAGFSGLPYMAAALAAGTWLLLYPSVGLVQNRERSRAQAVFNSASYYPLALLLIVAARTIVLASGGRS